MPTFTEDQRKEAILTDDSSNAIIDYLAGTAAEDQFDPRITEHQRELPRRIAPHGVSWP